MTGNISVGVTLHYEMASTLEDFQRLLPAVATVEYDPTLNQFTHDEPGKCWNLQLSNPRKRHVAGLKLPLVDVALTFDGYTEAEIDPVIERFFTYFRRGGG
jgi:hypothetical protein